MTFNTTLSHTASMTVDELLLPRLTSIQTQWHLNPIQSSLALVGAAVLAYASTKLLHLTLAAFRPSTIKSYLSPTHPDNTWALITGATDGIGKGFAHELLALGFNVCLHGRNPSKLATVKTELSSLFPARSISTVVADASLPTDAYLDVVSHALALPGRLAILVNNVGGITTTPQCAPFPSIPTAHLDTCLNLNIRFPVLLTRALLPHLRGPHSSPSLILNIGSAAGVFGIPYVATYSGTKAFINTFTLALRNEFRAEGMRDVHVWGFKVGNVATAANTRDVPFLTTSSRECARGCLGKVGSSKALLWPHWKHALPSVIMGALPERWCAGMLADEMKQRVEAEGGK